jgi:catechol 2,3-dioxygenase-like lactoylglutathione lyase family enzyme
MIEVNGAAHVFLTVSRIELAIPFYERLLHFLGMRTVMKAEGAMLYCVGGRTAIGIQAAEAQYRGERFVQPRVGLHHLCLRARSREDVDRVYAELQAMGSTIVHPPEDGTWAPGYYSVLFEDPDGIRLEVNFVPGKGLLAAT